MAEARCLVSPARVFARPTADQIWLGEAQQAALSQLSRNTRIRLLVGPPSSGKSTLVNHVADRLGRDGVVLQCRGPKDDAVAVLSSLLLSADLAPWELSEVEQRNLFTVFVQQRRLQGKRVVLVMDDAHTFKAAAWEEVERLVSFRARKARRDRVTARGPSFARGTHRPRTRGRRSKRAQRAQARFPVSSRSDEVCRLAVGALRDGRSRDPRRESDDRPARGRPLRSRRRAVPDVAAAAAPDGSLDRVDARVAQQAIATLVARQGAKLEAGGASNGEQPHDVPPQGYLLISRGGKVLSRITLGQRTLLGRSEHNDVCLPSPYLSRHHAAIVGTPEGYYVVDLNSVNGLLHQRPQGGSRGALRSRHHDDRAVSDEGADPGLARARQPVPERIRSPRRQSSRRRAAGAFSDSRDEIGRHHR